MLLPVTVNHPPGDCKSPPYIEVDPLKQIPVEVDPDKHPPTPQRGDESEPVIEAEIIFEDPERAIEFSPTTNPIETPSPVGSKNLGKDSSSALVPVDPFLNRRSSLSYQKERALEASLVGSPFETIESQDKFYSQLLAYIRATSPHLNPGKVTGTAKTSLKRIMSGTPDPEDRRILILWQNNQLEQFQGLTYSEGDRKRSEAKKRLEATAARYFAEQESSNG